MFKKEEKKGYICSETYHKWQKYRKSSRAHWSALLANHKNKRVLEFLIYLVYNMSERYKKAEYNKYDDAEYKNAKNLLESYSKGSIKVSELVWGLQNYAPTVWEDIKYIINYFSVDRSRYIDAEYFKERKYALDMLVENKMIRKAKVLPSTPSTKGYWLCKLEDLGAEIRNPKYIGSFKYNLQGIRRE